MPKREQRHVVLHEPERGKIPQLWETKQRQEREESKKRGGRRSRTQVEGVRVRRRVPKSGRRERGRRIGLCLCPDETETDFVTHWRLEEWIREEGAESLQTALPRGGIDTRFRTGAIHGIGIANTRPAC